jgi:hypothetical protein
VKVQVTDAAVNTYWYGEYTGEIFEVTESELSEDLYVVDREDAKEKVSGRGSVIMTLGEDLFIHKDDCKVIHEINIENTIQGLESFLMLLETEKAAVEDQIDDLMDKKDSIQDEIYIVGETLKSLRYQMKGDTE